MTTTKLVTFILFTVFAFSLSAQGLKGKVYDEYNQPIPGVNILNSTNGTHAHSDINGSFILENVSVADTLLFSYIGFKPSVKVIKSVENPMQCVLEIQTISLNQVVIKSDIDALNLLTTIDLKVDPVKNSQEILQQVPGLFIGQHAGGGKAEQIFLRGFDIDHGTDVSISVDGMPVNMVSHAHGQGYADLHFLIPETVDKVNFGKGPYYGDQGNFNTAGYVDLRTKDRLKNNSFGLEVGQFSSQRMLGMFKLIDKDRQQAYIATEFISTDGPFDSPQNFSRSNVFAKYSGYTSDKVKIGVIASNFNSSWDASGQIPQRKVDDGSINRFGAIDDTEGGKTSRSNVIVQHDKYIDDYSFISSKFYLFNYDFELFSNFTFFLNDSINGDQIRQFEKRRGMGMSTDYTRIFDLGKLDAKWRTGINLRNDRTEGTELSRTLNRSETLSLLKKGDIAETNAGAFTEFTLSKGKLTLVTALRLDVFRFQYNDDLIEAYSTQTKDLAILSPKLSLLFNQTDNLQYYLKLGKGFHSNDSRVVVESNDKQVLPAAYGSDLGFIWKASPRLILNCALWQLYLEQEFVYVGDEGIVEPSGSTERMGFDISGRYQANDWLFLNVDANYTFARSLESPNGEDYIPLSPDMTMVVGVNVVDPSGFHVGLNMRHIGDRPANEDYSIIAEGYTVIDMNAGYQFDRFDLGFKIQNLLDTKWNETQFATESRLQDETEAVEEIHFTPGTPFFASGSVAFKF